MCGPAGRLARLRDWVWGKDEIGSATRFRAATQVTVLAASVLAVIGLFHRSEQIVRASGLLLMIAGTVRAFPLEDDPAGRVYKRSWIIFVFFGFLLQWISDFVPKLF